MVPPKRDWKNFLCCVVRNLKYGSIINIYLATASDQLEEMLVKKIRQGRVLFDFTQPLSEVAQKDIKRDVLLELIDFFQMERGYLTPPVYKETLEMVCS